MIKFVGKMMEANERLKNEMFLHVFKVGHLEQDFKALDVLCNREL